MGRHGPRKTWRRLTAETAAAHLAEWRQSGKRLSEYAREVGLTYQRLRRWQLQLESDEVAERPAFLPVRVMEAVPADGGSAGTELEIHAPGGLRIVVPANFEAGALERLLRVVRRASC
jgi:hypothetical protein